MSRHHRFTSFNREAMASWFKVETHLINRDPKSALIVVDDMIKAGFEPSMETLKKLRRRCVREIDYENDDQVEALAKKFQIRIWRWH
ncbi:hypothetical protein ISN45_Aa02g000280 [Arabidopsis thaliana x Arabidopsis arenosa]|uniref:Pentatricopeptide repeat-containing protein n=1 Tax=Arabidopsis thaliana x Arabidopsis arenosa TaxID=1240361 RepID=A0A8T2BCS0_9BRAS|nr:hypothetical protein ISN45_Aa02g000280 [Arabidopsis thaliana x Arabidopsis arenosa]KAG7584626.1 hypothetical protein ISN45_Aa02g000280 [Arabidopsis thaliana x Arabidopsis arenosa]KAG7584627.1 hypothetical protein ISN45_Aa02g000280 [Arabidopsis thaliana x Arabidopsis arenosa]